METLEGNTGVVHKFERGVFLSTEGAGIAPAVPSKAPRVDGDIMIVYETPTDRAYRVRPRTAPKSSRELSRGVPMGNQRQ